jgi:cob(I)alamin adenosyltransferase
LYTRRGDKGETSLYGAKRVPKDSPRVEAYGSVDELNSYLGVVISHCRFRSVASDLKAVQRQLFIAGADLATERAYGDRIVRIKKGDTKEIEKKTDALLKKLPGLSVFILPGGAPLAAELQYARAVCRRAERRVVAASKGEGANPELIPFFNRLSSYLFNLARWANMASARKEEPWKS